MPMAGKKRSDDLQVQHDDGTIECLVCPQACRIADGRRGRCFSVVNDGSRLTLQSYGFSSGFCVDPVEKKPLNHFFPGTPILSFGTTGCNLSCKFCQNCEISMNQRKARLAQSASPEQIVEAAVDAGCRSIAFTYNEPTAFFEYAIDVARIAQSNGLKVAAVTNGYIHGTARERFYEHIDAANVDLKSISDGFYRGICGASLEPVLETLQYIRGETETWLEVTNLIIPGHNDGADEVLELCEWIVSTLGVDTPLHFSAFHPQHKMLHVPRTPASTVIDARQCALDAGLRYVYTGNIHNPDGESTYCPNCRKLLISRTGYEIGAWCLDEHGNCDDCGARVAGRFESQPGSWGNRRQPLSV